MAKERLVELQLLRVKRGISQKQLALDIGVKPSTISMIEKGANLPSLALAYKISKYFNVSIEQVFFRG